MMGASFLGHFIKAFCAMKYLKWVHLNTPPPPSSFFLIPRLWSTVTSPGKNIGSLRHYKNLGKCVYAPTIAAFRSRRDWKSVLFDQTGGGDHSWYLQGPVSCYKDDEDDRSSPFFMLAASSSPTMVSIRPRPQV